MPRKPDPENQQAKINIGTLKLGLNEIRSFKVALEFYGWQSIASFLRQAALALIRHHAAGETIGQPLSFQVFTSQPPGPGNAAAAVLRQGHDSGRPPNVS
jgi:hypothetical protein